MTIKGRRQIDQINSKLQDIYDILQEILDDEQCKYDNMPESIQNSDRGYEFEEIIEHIETAVESIGGAIDELGEIVEG